MTTFGAVNGEFEHLLSTLDRRLFERIPSQTSPNEQQSLLACQLATRELVGEYGYLEIGSYLGGSIQPHLLDRACRRIYSIDKRPRKQPDERGITYKYQDNTTERMLDHLRDVDAEQLSKVTCFDTDTGALSPPELRDPVHLCLIDGEHTDEAVVRDFEFCFRLLAGHGVVLFDDAQIVYRGLKEVVDRLEARGHPFHAYNLPDFLMVFELGDFAIHRHPTIAERLLDNHVGYLNSLLGNDRFREFANRPAVLAFRRIRARLKRIDTSA